MLARYSDRLVVETVSGEWGSVGAWCNPIGKRIVGLEGWVGRTCYEFKDIEGYEEGRFQIFESSIPFDVLVLKYKDV